LSPLKVTISAVVLVEELVLVDAHEPEHRRLKSTDGSDARRP
jgi:hypothetical protein